MVDPLTTSVLLVPVRPLRAGRLRIRSRIKNSPHYLSASTSVLRGGDGGRLDSCVEVANIDLTNRPYFVGNMTHCVAENVFGVAVRSTLEFSPGLVGSVRSMKEMERMQVYRK